MLLACEKKTDAWAAQARNEVAPPTTRAFDNLKTDADRKHERLQACRRHLHGGALVFRGLCIEFSSSNCTGPRSWREGGSARSRSLQRLQLRCRVFCRLYCRCTYSTLRESSIVAQVVSSPVKYFVHCLLSCKICGVCVRARSLCKMHGVCACALSL